MVARMWRRRDGSSSNAFLRQDRRGCYLARALCLAATRVRLVCAVTLMQSFNGEKTIHFVMSFIGQLAVIQSRSLLPRLRLSVSSLPPDSKRRLRRGRRGCCGFACALSVAIISPRRPRRLLWGMRWPVDPRQCAARWSRLLRAIVKDEVRKSCRDVEIGQERLLGIPWRRVVRRRELLDVAQDLRAWDAHDVAIGALVLSCCDPLCSSPVEVLKQRRPPELAFLLCDVDCELPALFTFLRDDDDVAGREGPEAGLRREGFAQALPSRRKCHPDLLQ